LKISATEDPQAKEMAETEGHKEKMLKLIMEQNAQIKEMEAKLEKLVKEKEKSVPMAVIPLNAVPLIGVSTATTTSVTTTEASEKLAKSMEDMSLQGQEIERLG
jgi:glucosamine 6-phosphate synthetase-like amidotransferase/phosphosugar isomerase protein